MLFANMVGGLIGGGEASLGQWTLADESAAIKEVPRYVLLLRNREMFYWLRIINSSDRAECAECILHFYANNNGEQTWTLGCGAFMAPLYLLNAARGGR